MFGSTGPTVSDQVPSASLVIFCGVLTGAPGRIHSPATVTSPALGARKRKVIVRSGRTSGDCKVSAGGAFTAGGFAAGGFAGGGAFAVGGGFTTGVWAKAARPAVSAHNTRTAVFTVRARLAQFLGH